MKFTNIKQLIIKFVGGGIINFPTRFLRWVKINGDVDDSDGGGIIDKFYIKLNRENLHLDYNYSGFDPTIGHDLDFFFEDTDINLVSKIIENITEQINNIPEGLSKPGIYSEPQFSYTSIETGLILGTSNGVYPIFNIKYNDDDNKLIINIGRTNYEDVSVSAIDINFVQKEDGKFYYKPE